MTHPDIDWLEDDDRDEIARVNRHAFAYEVGCYGIADGVDRLPLDPDYLAWPEYRRGHRIGLTMAPSDEARARGRA